MLKRTHDTHTHSHAGSLCAAATLRRRDYGAHTHRRVHALPSETVPPVPVCLSGPSSCGHPARPSGHSSEERDKTSRRGAAVSHCCVNFPTRSSAERAPKHPWAGLPSLAPPRPASARPVWSPQSRRRSRTKTGMWGKGVMHCGQKLPRAMAAAAEAGEGEGVEHPSPAAAILVQFGHPAGGGSRRGARRRRGVRAPLLGLVRVFTTTECFYSSVRSFTTCQRPIFNSS